MRTNNAVRIRITDPLEKRELGEVEWWHVPATGDLVYLTDDDGTGREYQVTARLWLSQGDTADVVLEVE